MKTFYEIGLRGAVRWALYFSPDVYIRAMKRVEISRLTGILCGLVRSWAGNETVIWAVSPFGAART
ncbi:MAG: hypothetical protein NT121_18165 [Chloroflexi bacterium]|nr:hypothetical protein [Chloroflexota bacterium]